MLKRRWFLMDSASCRSIVLSEGGGGGRMGVGSFVSGAVDRFRSETRSVRQQCSRFRPSSIERAPGVFGCRISLLADAIALASSLKSAVSNETGFPILCDAMSNTVTCRICRIILRAHRSNTNRRRVEDSSCPYFAACPFRSVRK